MNNEETTSASLGHSATDGNTPFAPHGKMARTHYFNVDDDTFAKARMSRAKGFRWSTFMGKSELTDNIRLWARKNGNPDIMFRSPRGQFMFAQKGIKKS